MLGFFVILFVFALVFSGQRIYQAKRDNDLWPSSATERRLKEAEADQAKVLRGIAIYFVTLALIFVGVIAAALIGMWFG
jgi:hypothetical protein